jgi:hypothetical protein
MRLKLSYPAENLVARFGDSYRAYMELTGPTEHRRPGAKVPRACKAMRLDGSRLEAHAGDVRRWQQLTENRQAIERRKDCFALAAEGKNLPLVVSVIDSHHS